MIFVVVIIIIMMISTVISTGPKSCPSLSTHVPFAPAAFACRS
jgi:hypothetical protein